MSEWQINLAVTVGVLAMVFLLPWLDRRICRKLGLNLEGGLSNNARADMLMVLRQGLLYLVFGIYIVAVAWLVFLSRDASANYLIHVALYQDLQQAVQIDLGILGLLRTLFTEGVQAALSHIRVVKMEDISQVYRNVMLFVPMGYLLPYISRWFRAKVLVRPAVTCFLISFFVENLQLIGRRGFYDVDDLVSNTLGGIIGQLLFISVAYVITHPDWRQELHTYFLWKKNARKRTLYPFVRKLGLTRTTIQATMEDDVRDFYVAKLGFRIVKQLIPLDTASTDILLSLGKSQVEIHCFNHIEFLPTQTLTISARRLKPIIRRLNENGIQTEPMAQDPYTGHRCVSFFGPDGVRITVVEV